MVRECPEEGPYSREREEWWPNYASPDMFYNTPRSITRNKTKVLLEGDVTSQPFIYLTFHELFSEKYARGMF